MSSRMKACAREFAIFSLLCIASVVCPDMGSAASTEVLLLAASSADPDWSPPEQFVWTQTLSGNTTDFNTKCHATPDPQDGAEPEWDNKCRMVRGSFIEEILTKSPWRDAVPHQGLLLSGARVTGGLSLVNAKITPAVAIVNSLIEQDLDLTRAQLMSFFTIEGSNVLGRFRASKAHTKDDISLRAGTYHNEVNFEDVKVNGSIDAIGATFRDRFVGSNSYVGGSVALDKARFSNGLWLDGARIDGSLQMSQVEATVQPGKLGDCDGLKPPDYTVAICAVRLRVKGILQLSDGRFDHSVFLNASQIDGNVVLQRADINDGLYGAFARVGDNIEGSAAIIHDNLVFFGIHVGGNIGFNRAEIVGKAGLFYSKIGGNLDLNDTTLTEFDLTGASIGGSFQLGYHYVPGPSWREASWRENGGVQPVPIKPRLTLINAEAGALEDSWVCDDSQGQGHDHGWPPALDLKGFDYRHLGTTVSSAPSEQDMRSQQPCPTNGIDIRARPITWWRSWLEKDPVYSPLPYGQLASVLLAAGYRQEANDVAYEERGRRAREAWNRGHLGEWTLLAALDVFAGYGIGDYTFRVLYWVLGFTLLGIILLSWGAPGSQPRTIWWRLGASLTRLLPGIEINKEFSDFFNDPKRRRLRGWQIAIFSVLVLVGWVLGLFLVAALTGLTQHI